MHEYLIMRLIILVLISFLAFCLSLRQQRNYNIVQISRQYFLSNTKEAFLQRLFPSPICLVPRAMTWVLRAKKGYGQSPFEDDAFFPPATDDDEVLEDDEDIDDGIDNVTGLRSMDDDEWEGGDGDEDDDDAFEDAGGGKDSFADSESSDSGGGDRVMTWKERLASSERRRSGSGRSWEDKFLEDPLKGNNPTVDVPVERPLGRFRRTYVAIGHVAAPDSMGEQDEEELADRMLRREQAWLPHMQWFDLHFIFLSMAMHYMYVS